MAVLAEAPDVVGIYVACIYPLNVVIGYGAAVLLKKLLKLERSLLITRDLKSCLTVILKLYDGTPFLHIGAVGYYNLG